MAPVKLHWRRGCSEWFGGSPSRVAVVYSAIEIIIPRHARKMDKLNERFSNSNSKLSNSN